MNIILIGYRGSGKTTVGQMVAKQLGWQFVDIDEQACQKIGMHSIADIWQKHGEPYWRQVEVDVTVKCCDRSGHVIGLGGGTVMQLQAREAIEQANSLRIYLKCDPQAVLERVAGDQQSGQSRPNLTALGGGLDEIEHVLAVRGPVYEAVSDETLDVTYLSVKQVSDAVVSLYHQHQTNGSNQ